MKAGTFIPEKEKNIDSTLKDVTLNRSVPKVIFLLLLALYFIASVALSRTSRSHGIIMLMGNPVPKSIFTGVFSALANICIIFLAVLFGKIGFITTIAILLCQFPLIISNMVLRHNYSSIPGLFTNIFTILAIALIYIYNRRTEEYQEKMREQAVTDMLTGLPNRFACLELMKSFIKKDEKFAIVLIDLNNFKSINDTMGHQTGNKMLVEIASRWKALADSHKTGTLDFVSRTGGDEYILLIQNYHSNIDIINTINSYEAELEKKILIDGCDYFMTASFGYAEFSADAATINSLLSCADAALHEVKRQRSSNLILHFTPDLLKTEHILETERKIRTALDNGLLFFHLQPQYDISHKLRGFEVLARMKDTDGTIISPGEFIPVAEKVGLIDRIDLHVFKSAACFLGDIIKKTGANITLSTNISVRHLMKNNFIDEIKEVLQISGIPADHVELEITESIMIDSAEKALKCINEVRSMGIKVAIDDFGTGYSSLSYLNKFPANLLKIDKSFIDVMNSSDSSKQYVAAIISIGHIMNLEVISEGVEIPEQLETLQSIGCDYIQGYIWGSPMPPEEASKLITANT